MKEKKKIRRKTGKTYNNKRKDSKKNIQAEVLYSRTLEKINLFISKQLRKDFAGYSDTTKEMVFSSVESGGKRVRAIISFAVSKIFGQSDRKALELAYSIELSHSFTLIHDDIIDKPRERRGKSPLFMRFGEDLSLLAGDMLMTFSFIRIPDNAKNLFAKLMCDVIEGQILDVLWSCNWSRKRKSTDDKDKRSKIDERKIVEIQAKKTSSLFMISFVVPFVSVFSGKNVRRKLMNRRKRIESLLSKLGYNFGLAFQILDDIDDVEEDASKGSPNILHVLGREKTKKLFVVHKDKTLTALSDFEVELQGTGLKGSIYLELLKHTIHKVLERRDSIR